MPLEKACLLGCCVPTGYGAAVNAAKVRVYDYSVPCTWIINSSEEKSEGAGKRQGLGIRESPLISPTPICMLIPLWT